jgi:hypothetical protein
VACTRFQIHLARSTPNAGSGVVRGFHIKNLNLMMRNKFNFFNFALFLMAQRGANPAWFTPGRASPLD